MCVRLCLVCLTDKPHPALPPVKPRGSQLLSFFSFFFLVHHLAFIPPPKLRHEDPQAYQLTADFNFCSFFFSLLVILIFLFHLVAIRPPQCIAQLCDRPRGPSPAPCAHRRFAPHRGGSPRQPARPIDHGLGRARDCDGDWLLRPCTGTTRVPCLRTRLPVRESPKTRQKRCVRLTGNKRKPFPPRELSKTTNSRPLTPSSSRSAGMSSQS